MKQALVKVHFRFVAIVFFVALLPSAYARQRIPEARQKRVDAAAEARSAFFVRSDLDATLRLTHAALKQHPRDPELLFLRMEAASLEADTTTTLDAALRLCARDQNTVDPRGIIAASRILDLAGNTAQFQQAIPQIRQLVSAGSPYASYLRSALIAAASEGAPGLKLLTLSRESGLLTDWHFAGPFGKYSNVAFEQVWVPEQEGLADSLSGDKPVERIRFNDGNFELPDYFDRAGVFYAATTFRSADNAQRTLRVESDGTLEVFVDGRSVLRKDNRFRTGSGIVRANLKLNPGIHQVLVKFIPSALPFRISVIPLIIRKERKLTGDPTELAFISAARNFCAGNYAEAATRLLALHNAHRSAPIDYLLASTWEHAANDSPEESNYLHSALKLSPHATAVEFRLAEKALAAGRTDEAWQRISAILSTNPDLASAQQMAARIAMSRDWTVEAISSIDALLRLHPTCASMEEAYKFYNGHEQFGRAKEILKRLETCAPDSTTYLELLSEAGEHEQAVRAAAKLVLTNPLSRSARYLEVRELALAGKESEAREAAQHLAKLAPNSSKFQKLSTSTEDLLGLLDPNHSHRRDFLESDPFYAPYRRDAMTVLRENSDTKPSASAITLLEDKVARLDDDGTVAVYFHRIVKVLTRSGIESYGEVSLPRNADILELRTIKQDGSIAEPEFQEHKSTISMPALSPGDAIDQEYVVHYADRNGISGMSEFTFTFGWFRTGLVSTRFVALTPVAALVATQELNGAPKAVVSIKGEERVQMWEQHDIPQFTEESGLPAREILPTVKVFRAPADGWVGIRDYYRDKLIEASCVGPRTLATVNSLHLDGTEYDRLNVLYEFVNSRIRSDSSSFANANISSAEDTLATNLGSRTTTLIALAHAAGIQADLVLARDISGNPPVITEAAFTHPLVQVNLHGIPITLDVESANMGTGSISPTLDRREALLVQSRATGVQKALISLAGSQQEQSVAEGDLRINPQGDLEARVTIKLGAWRAAQMRGTLSGIESGDRQQFLQQLAARIFNGATDVTGEIHNERKFDRPLDLVFRCRAPKFLNLSSAQVNTGQFAPVLGLRQMYANSATRRFPVYVNTPLVERTTFRVDLPQNVRLSRRVNTLDLRTEFGHYRLFARELGANSFEVTREFEIPVQVVTPGQYPDFLKFANQIDDAERQRFSFAVSNPVTNSNSPSE